MLALTLLLTLAEAPDATVVGVVVSRKPELSSAIVLAEGRSRVVGIGDSLSGAKVVEITPAGVTVDAGGERLELRLRGETAPSRPFQRGGAGAILDDAAAPATDSAPPIRTLSRAEVDARLRSEIPRILAETTLFPVTEEGRVVGFTLTRLPDGTLLSELGLQPGDVLLRINDVAIDSFPTLISLWTRLQNAPQLRAEVLRAGQPVSLVVNIR